MLPDTRRDEHLYVVPKFDLEHSDVKDFMNELNGFHEQFYDCFQRSESRDHFFNYMAGQFSPLERKSIEPIALAIEDGNVRAMQRFVSDAPWDEEKMLVKFRSLVNNDLGEQDGVLIFDERGFLKKGSTLALFSMAGIGAAKDHLNDLSTRNSGQASNVPSGDILGFRSSYWDLIRSLLSSCSPLSIRMFMFQS